VLFLLVRFKIGHCQKGGFGVDPVRWVQRGLVFMLFLLVSLV